MSNPDAIATPADHAPPALVVYGRDDGGKPHASVFAYSEADLARRLADVERLKAEPELAAFIAWVRTKPDDFHAPTRQTRRRRDGHNRRMPR